MKIVSNNGKWYLLNDKDKETTLTPLDKNKIYSIKNQTQTVRTYQANKALHKYFSLVAEALNDAGYSVQYILYKKKNDLIEKLLDWLYDKIKIKLILKAKDRILSEEEVSIPWTGENVKNLLWRTLQLALINKESTTKIDSKDIDIIYKTLDKLLSEKYGLESIDFPSEESMIFKQNYGG